MLTYKVVFLLVNGEEQSNIQEPFKLAFLILLPVRDNTAAWTCTPFIIAEFLSVANFGLISIVVYFEIKVYNMVKNSQATGRTPDRIREP